jgi:surfactin synthase thioesterase subunit
MIPAGFTFLDYLPLGSTGKVDRSRLSLLESAPAKHEEERLIAPRNETESILVDVWTCVLGRRVGVEDDFFDLGGHSLMAMELVHAVNARLGLDLPIRFIISEPSVAKQAVVIDKLHAYAPPKQQSFPLVVPLRAQGEKAPFFLVAGGFGAEHELLVYAGLAPHLDRPFYGLRIRGVDDLTAPPDGVEAIASELVREVRKVQPSGPYLLGGSCIGGVVALEMARQLQGAGEGVERLIMVDSTYPNWRWYGRYWIRAFRETWKNETTIELVARRLFSPSRNQQVEKLKFRFGKQYLRHTVRHAAGRFDGPIYLIISERQRNRDPTRVWREVAGGGLITTYVPGNHSSHLRQYAGETATAIETCLTSRPEAFPGQSGGTNFPAPR